MYLLIVDVSSTTQNPQSYLRVSGGGEPLHVLDPSPTTAPAAQASPPGVDLDTLAALMNNKGEIIIHLSSFLMRLLK